MREGKEAGGAAIEWLWGDQLIRRVVGVVAALVQMRLPPQLQREDAGDGQCEHRHAVRLSGAHGKAGEVSEEEPHHQLPLHCVDVATFFSLLS